MYSNRQQVCIAPVTPGWGESTVSMTRGSVTSTYYHSDTAAAVELWWNLASLNNAESGGDVRPFFFSDDTTDYENRLIYEHAGTSFSVNIANDDTAEKLGAGTSGDYPASVLEGVQQLSFDDPAEDASIWQPGMANITGVQADVMGGVPASNSSVSLPPIKKPQSIKLRALQQWAYTYQYLDIWEQDGRQAVYDLVVGNNYLSRVMLESVTMDTVDPTDEWIAINFSFMAVGL